MLFYLVTGKKIDITTFREHIVIGLCPNKRIPNPVNNVHQLTEGKRGRCSSCYDKMTKAFGRNHAVKNAKRVNTSCPGCPEKKYMCSKCFFTNHSVTLRK